jgi:CHAD domain-containing protein
MSFRFKHTESSLGEAVRRIAREQAETALAAAVASERPSDDRVHEARKCCKKLRSVLRLVRPHLGERHRIENSFLRDAAKRLSASRDAAVLLVTFDQLVRKQAGDGVRFAGLRNALSCIWGGDGACDAVEERLAVFADDFRELLERIDEWCVDRNGFEAVGDGLARSYGDGRHAMRAAFKSNDPLDWHEWRKRVKDHWYHVRLLRDVWKPVMKAREAELETLSDLLGEVHDLAVLHDCLTGLPEADTATAALLAEISRKRAKQQAAARPLGRRIYVEKRTALEKRIQGYWQVWRKDCSPADA